MNADERRFDSDIECYLHEELTEKIIGVFYSVYNELGFGFLESVNQRAMYIGLEDAGFAVQEKMPVPVWFRGHEIGEFEADLLVDGKVFLELKAGRALDASHEAQLLNYLRATSIEVGLLLNFGPKPQIKRRAFANERKRVRPN
jgi:GxxExxY protein